MGKYIDAEKLIVEIERQQRRLMVLSNTEQVDMRRDCALQNGVYNSILSFITSLQQEQPEMNLGKEFSLEYATYHLPGFIIGTLCDGTEVIDFIYKTARHFFELGLNARKEK